MQRIPKSRIRYFYKEVIRVAIGKNKHLVFSLRSDDRFSIAQTLNTETDDEYVDSHFKHAVAIFRKNMFGVLHALIYIIIRLPLSEIPQNEMKFVEELKRISIDSQSRFIAQTRAIGYSPVNFSGETYTDFHQTVEGNEFY